MKWGKQQEMKDLVKLNRMMINREASSYSFTVYGQTSMIQARTADSARKKAEAMFPGAKITNVKKDA